jgi:antirestriction protein ArdC
VRKGAKAELIVFYRNYETTPDPEDENDDGTRRVAKGSYVFNIDEVDGIEQPPPPEPLAPIERIEAVDRFIANTGAAIKIGGDRAFYRPSTDTIHMPAEELFTGTDTMNRREGFYAVELHELTHWSGAPTRCNRDKHEKFADEIYIREELIAEIASAMLCAELQITQDTRTDHAQYLAHWLNLLKDDPKAIFKAAAHASKAVTYLKSLQPQADTNSADASPRERAHAA